MQNHKKNQMDYVDYGSCPAGTPGSKKGVAGVRFSLAPMSDNYVEQILSAIEQVDLSKVWSQTDKTSTVYRGSDEAVMDAIRACFIYAYQEGVHMSLDATFSKGCPGDVDADYTLELEQPKINAAKIQNKHFYVAGRFAIYPLGTDTYMAIIADLVNQGIDRGVIAKSAHYATILEGDVQEIFDYLELVFTTLSQSVSHFVVELGLACNFPEDE